MNHFCSFDMYLHSPFLFHFGFNARYVCSSQIVEFISVLLTIGSETAEQELINQSAVKRSIDLFFQ